MPDLSKLVVNIEPLDDEGIPSIKAKHDEMIVPKEVEIELEAEGVDEDHYKKFDEGVMGYEYDYLGRGYKVVRKHGVPTKVRMTQQELRKLASRKISALPEPRITNVIYAEKVPDTGETKVIGPWGLGFPVEPHRVITSGTCDKVLHKIIMEARKIKAPNISYPRTKVERRKRAVSVFKIVEYAKTLEGMKCRVVGKTQSEFEWQLQESLQELLEDPDLGVYMAQLQKDEVPGEDIKIIKHRIEDRIDFLARKGYAYRDQLDAKEELKAPKADIEMVSIDELIKAGDEGEE